MGVLGRAGAPSGNPPTAVGVRSATVLAQPVIITAPAMSSAERAHDVHGQVSNPLLQRCSRCRFVPMPALP